MIKEQVNLKNILVDLRRILEGGYRGMYNCSDSGDEFYLVLSKPHTGNILLAYNTKQFDMDDSFLYRKP